MTAMRSKGKFFVGGNWKCNETIAQVKQLVDELNAGTVPSDIEIVVAPTFIHLAMVRSCSRGAVCCGLGGCMRCRICWG